MLPRLLYIILLAGLFVTPALSVTGERPVRPPKGAPLDRKPYEYRFTHYDDHNGMSQWHLTRILQDARGYLWFATWNGLNRFDGYEFAVFKSQPGDGNNLTSDRIRNMQLGDDGNIYCVINEHVWRFNLTTYRFEEPDAATRERYHTRLKFDTVVQKEHSATVGGRQFDRVRQVFMDSQRNAWIMGQYGVFKASPAPQPAQMVTSVPADIVRSIHVDRKKRIWVTTRNQGVVTLLDSLANLIGYLGPDGRLHPQPLPFAPVYCVAEQRNGTIWLGTKPSGLFRLKEAEEGTFHIERFVKGTEAQVRKGETINCNDIYDIHEDRRGRLWIATHGGGLNLLERSGGGMKFLNKDNTFKSYPANNVFMRRLMIVGDTLILATTTEGFLVVKGIMGTPSAVSFNLHLRESRRAESLSCSAVMDMLFDRKSRLFVSTESGGVNMLLTKDLSSPKFSFRHFNTSNGMGSDVALAMTEVGDEILVQCNNQVTRLNADLNETENFNDLFFSIASRFSDAEPVMLKDGRWLLSLETGLMVMPEESFHQRSYIPRIVLTSFSVPGRPVDYTADVHDTIRLAPSERNISIQYAALDYTDNSHIKYVTRMSQESRWRLGGDALGWTAPQDTRSISFYDLSPGTYKLEIRSTNAEGLWTDNTRTVFIVVEPTFWETPLAYIIYILLTIGIISGITYTVLYIRTLKRQREENLKAYLSLFEQKESVAEPPLATDSAPVTAEPAPETAATAAPSLEEVGRSLPHISEEDNTFMRRLMTFVDENLGNSSIGVDEMASATATSRSSLNRKTKSLLGVTPADFLKEARMKRACQQLLDTSKGVNDIAYSCGFSDPKYFSKCFKASIGMSPSEYRNSRK